LHDVSGSARCLPFSAVLARDAAGRQAIPSVEVEVPVAGMDTRNNSRDGKMREMFRSERFPRIRAAAHDVDVERLRVEIGKGREGNASIDLLLRIRDVERKVRATASNLKESGDRVTFDLEFPVSLGEFDLKPPSVLGIIRVGDKVSVKANFTLTVLRSP
jgi:polyisoprenoid-binding protein YceI